MFSEDVTALDFDDDEEGNDVGGGGGGGGEVDVSDAIVDDDASLYPSSPELGARTSNFLRDQVLLQDACIHTLEIDVSQNNG